MLTYSIPKLQWSARSTNNFFIYLKSFQALKIRFKFLDFDIQICKQFRNETTKMESLGDLKLVVEYVPPSDLVSSPKGTVELKLERMQHHIFSSSTGNTRAHTVIYTRLSNN